FGFARMLTDVPVGLFITHHLGRALRLGPLVLLAGALLVAGGGTFGMLLLGRALMGAGHTLATLACLTAILRYRAGSGLASALAATELAAMFGVLAGAALTALLPRAVQWNAALLLACAPVLLTVALLPLGALADRRGARPVLGVVLLVFATAMGLVAFGTLPLVALGCALYGLAMAGWTLPLGLLRSVTPPAQVAWRTALYRVAVDGG